MNETGTEPTPMSLRPKLLPPLLLLGACLVAGSGEARAGESVEHRIRVVGWRPDDLSAVLEESYVSVAHEPGHPASDRCGKSLYLLVTRNERVTGKWIGSEFHDDSEDPASCQPAEANKLWSEADARPDDLFRGWAQKQPQASESASETVPLGGGVLALEAKLVRGEKKGCASASLELSVGPVKKTMLETDCAPGELKSASQQVEWRWSADGAAIAIAWTPTRVTVAGASRSDAHWFVLAARNLISIDLLDAGAGEAVNGLAYRLGMAGYAVKHQGQAQAPHQATSIYVPPGLEDIGRELAKLAGAPPESVEPLSWKSPYAITIALAGPPHR